MEEKTRAFVCADFPDEVVTKSRVLADGYRTFWKFMWDFCEE